MISFLLLFGLMLLFSGFFIVGFYNITRGRWEVKVDGERKWTGKIFNFWHKLLQTHELKTEFFTGDEFYKKASVVMSLGLDKYKLVKVYNDAVEVDKISTEEYLMLRGKAAQAGILINGIKNEDPQKSSVYDSTLISIYREVPEYKISRYITDPLGMCITCMSSFYGTLLFAIWWLLMAKVQVVSPTKPVEFFLSLWWGYKAVLWVVFCISLTYFNDTLLNIKKYFGKE